MHKVTVGYVNGTEETYYVSRFEYEGTSGLALYDVRWRDKPLAEVGLIPSTAILAIWASKAGDQH